MMDFVLQFSDPHEKETKIVSDNTHVIFGTGPLGTSVMQALTADEQRVRMVNRSGKADVPNGVEVMRGDACDSTFTRQVCKGASAVYQCSQPAYNEWTEKFPPLQASILEGAAAAGAKLIVGENLYMYGPVKGPMTEDLPNAATTRKGRVRAQMSEALLAAHRTGKVRVAIGRGSDFFGPGVLAAMIGERVIYPALADKAAQAVGDIDTPHTQTYIEDFGKGLAVLGQRDEALGQIWHVPNPQTVTTRQFITMVFEEIGKPPKISSMGKMMMRIGGLFVPAAREVVEMMYEFEQPFVVDSSKYERAFGNHATPLPDAIRKTVAWYRAHPHPNHK
jgi:nucleoside-diphosphate-sugar epimerase